MLVQNAFLEITFSRIDGPPFYICLLSDLAFEWQRGWRWSCFHTDLTAFVVQISSCSNANQLKFKCENHRFVSKQGHLSLACIYGQVTGLLLNKPLLLKRFELIFGREFVPKKRRLQACLTLQQINKM